SKFSSRTSISKTSAPRDRNALATPRAVASDTSRSDPGPPINTAIRFGNALISVFWGAPGCQPATAGSLPAEIFVWSRSFADVLGKLPSTAGWQPALPRVPRSIVFPSRFLPHDLHFSL